MLLQKTEQVAKARQNVSEMLLSQISEDMRQQRRIKEQSFKRVWFKIEPKSYMRPMLHYKMHWPKKKR